MNDRVWLIRCPGNAPTTSELHRMPWAARHRHAQDCRDLVRLLCIEAGVPYLERARVTATRYSVGQPDYDNSVGALKAYVDGLKNTVIADDDPAHLDITYQSARSTRKDARVELCITAWPESRNVAPYGQEQQGEGA